MGTKAFYCPVGYIRENLIGAQHYNSKSCNARYVVMLLTDDKLIMNDKDSWLVSSAMAGRAVKTPQH